ncbi:MAG TPA: DUF2111 domain-containing protein [Methanoculleus sp.]|nr:DUF2111 domain-containing protein [Methanoculleus sp.]
MGSYILSVDSGPDDLTGFAMCIHEVVNRLPITARSLNKNGVRIEEGRVVDSDYTGPVLEAAMKQNGTMKHVPESGAYKGIPVIVAPLHGSAGEVIGAVGLVDITGIFDLGTLMEHQSMIMKQVCGRDPCPLPTELIDAKK